MFLGKKRPDRFFYIFYPGCGGCEEDIEIALVIVFEIRRNNPFISAASDAMKKMGSPACFFMNGKRMVAFHADCLPTSYHPYHSLQSFSSCSIVRYTEQARVMPAHA